MKTISAGEFKIHFSAVMEQVNAGREIAVTYENNADIIGYFLPEKTKRKSGIPEGKAAFTFGQDWDMTTEEFLEVYQFSSSE